MIPIDTLRRRYQAVESCWRSELRWMKK